MFHNKTAKKQRCKVIFWAFRVKILSPNPKGEIVQEYTSYVLGFVPATVVHLKRDIWLSKLSKEQINSVNKFLELKKFSWN
jgi:hypothetical protein